MAVDNTYVKKKKSSRDMDREVQINPISTLWLYYFQHFTKTLKKVHDLGVYPL